MWGFLTSLFSAGTGAVINAGADAVARTITGDKVQQEHNAHEEQTALRAQYAAEVSAASGFGRTRWDSFVDGLNRLVRPTFTFGVIYLFWLAVQDPREFSIVMTALQLVPMELWTLLGLIVGFWFGSLWPLHWIVSLEALSVAGVVVVRFSAIAACLVPMFFVA